MTKLTVDKKLIRDLAKILQETGLNEVEWAEGEVRLRVARGAPAAQTVAMRAAAAGTAEAAAPIAAKEDWSSHPGAVKSPMVGTAYVAPEPGAAPFVQVGDQVREGQTLLIVEAMKTMNPIPATRGGRVARVLVSNQQPVEYDQPLVIIE